MNKGKNKGDEFCSKPMLGKLISQDIRMEREAEQNLREANSRALKGKGTWEGARNAKKQPGRISKIIDDELSA